MRELGPSLRNASCKHCIPLGSTSNTYNLNSIAANSSYRSAIWRARHRSSLIRLARAHGSPTVTWPQQVRTRVAMVHHETSSVNGIFFTFIPVIVDDIADPLKTCVNERATCTRGCDGHRCVATTRILLPDLYRGECARLLRPLLCTLFFARILDDEITWIWNRIHVIYGTYLFNDF